MRYRFDEGSATARFVACRVRVRVTHAAIIYVIRCTWADLLEKAVPGLYTGLELLGVT